MENLIEACNSMNIAEVKDLLFTKRGDQRYGYLDQLVRYVTDAKMLCRLFNMCGEDVNDFFKKHQPYLFGCAITQGKDKNIIEVILNLDKNLINTNVVSMTPFAMAVSCTTDVGLIQFLLDNNADINGCGTSGKAPLHFTRSPEVVKLLIENGADVNRTDTEGETPIMTALRNREGKEVILEFIKNGADLNIRNRKGQTCLHLGLCYKYDEDIIDKICNKTNDLNVEDNEGLTPLCHAFNYKYVDFVVYRTELIYKLIEKGFIVNTKVFMYVLGHCDDVDLIKSLAKYVDVKCVDKDGNGVLHHAQDARLISWFIRRGVSVSRKNNAGRTPLVAAMMQNRIEVVESLLFWGSDIKNLDYILCPVAEQYPFILGSIYDLLVLYGMSVNLKNRFVKLFLSLSLHKISSYGMEHYMYLRGLLGHVFLSNKNVVLPEDLMMDPRINDFIKTYKSEVNKLKDENFAENISYYDFCFKQYRLVRCQFVDEGVTEADWENIKKLFPMFYNEVIVKIKMNIKIYKRKALLRRIMNVSLAKRWEGENNSNSDVDSICDHINLDVDCMYVLGSFMNDREINCLLAAAIID